MSLQQHIDNTKIAQETCKFLAPKDGQIVCIIGLGKDGFTDTSFVFANPVFSNEQIIDLMKQLLDRLKLETSQIISNG